MNILFKNGRVRLPGATATTLEHAHIATGGGKITYVGQAPPPGRFARVIDCRGGILLPGLVNAHTHSPMALLRGMRDDCSLEEWLREVIWPVEGTLTPEEIQCGTRLAIAEMLASGTVSFSDMYRHSLTVAEAIAGTKIKANICESITGGPVGEDGRAAPQLAEARELVRRWHGHGDGLIRCDTSIQSIFQTTPALWDAIAGLACDEGIGVHIHLSETREEQNACKGQWGMTPTAALHAHGVLGARLVASHGTFLEPEDIELLGQAGASVVHNPASNLKTCCVTARLRPLLEGGINVALGTDGVCSNNTGDMFAAMGQTALFQKGFENDPGWMSAAQVFEIATLNGWASQGRAGESGLLAEGYEADIILLDGEHPGLLPPADPLATAVYAANGGHVRLTMVRGEILYENGTYTTIDMERLLYGVKQFAARP